MTSADDLTIYSTAALEAAEERAWLLANSYKAQAEGVDKILADRHAAIEAELARRGN